MRCAQWNAPWQPNSKLCGHCGAPAPSQHMIAIGSPARPYQSPIRPKPVAQKPFPSTLVDKLCANNTEVGICFSGSSGGLARGNTSTGNKSGIYVEESANLDLQDNESSENSVADTVVP
jgi:parallel beta-helix repeat protein